MNRLLLFFMIGIMGYASEVTVAIPSSPNALNGKSVYTPPAAAVDVAEEGCVQKEDQNTTGYGNAKW
ncbi:MAG TPA: hypothetical protein VJA83_02305 [Sulfuricurvum sp.]|nr:hypothetical protein [Sulfuricurvum sp.]